MSAPMPDSLMFDLLVASRLAGDAVDQAMVGTSTTPTEYGYLSVLVVARSASISEIARGIGSPIPTVSRHLLGLEEAGIVRSDRDESDGRRRLYALTELGRARYDEAKLSFTTMHHRLVERLGDDVDLIRWALYRLTAGLRDLGGAAAPEPANAPNHVVIASDGLSPGQIDELRHYAQWLRHRDAAPAPVGSPQP